MNLTTKKQDCFVEWRRELEQQAKHLEIWDTDKRMAWFDAAKDLLDAVEDASKRCDWAYILAWALMGKYGVISVDMALGTLLNKEE